MVNLEETTRVGALVIKTSSTSSIGLAAGLKGKEETQVELDNLFNRASAVLRS